MSTRLRRNAALIRTWSWSSSGPRQLLTDKLTSDRLGRVRQSGTVPELAVRRLLRSVGVSFGSSGRGLPGSPDISNRRRRWVIFVHGCYWHRHAGCSRATIPKRNRSFWIDKFDANHLRDRRTRRQLRLMGYSVLVLWECQVDVGRHSALRARICHWLEKAAQTPSTLRGPQSQSMIRRLVRGTKG